jgi:hypothetical protein
MTLMCYLTGASILALRESTAWREGRSCNCHYSPQLPVVYPWPGRFTSRMIGPPTVMCTVQTACASLPILLTIAFFLRCSSICAFNH